ncbi:amino acid adenylation domain-containing protein [Parapedobacter sp. ISTM3]|uniref:polyketide synthase n=1 Tax=Parapedobacter sp. ISTM3 TaxID=2800130 RepID=UPI00190578BB|nr:polyketide synthase [Parapedobacter sp. ISTM3]MBK1439222.1 amino acid adenylation domain-containing protein [Parapedobacter sp. ISTM3]
MGLRQNGFQPVFTITDLFSTVLQAGHLDTIAIEFNTDSLTYRELDLRSDSVANALAQYAPDEMIVGVSTTRCTDMVVFLLGILKAGRFYLPLDPAHPDERLQQIIADSGIRHIACSLGDTNRFEKLGLAPITLPTATEHATTVPKATSCAGYILYTSGSTGKPKGVKMGETALANLLQWQRNHSVAATGTKTLQFAPLTFDVSFQEIFATLTTGGTLVLVEDDLRLNPIELLKFIEQRGINRLFLPFVALQLLADTAAFSNLYPRCLQEIMTAGEQLKVTPQIVSFFERIPDAVLYNQYGPTEAHVVSSLKLEGPPLTWPELPSIGTPISNVDLLILDEQQRLVKDGEIGELYIAGMCLADGYLNNTALTEERFIHWTHPAHGTIRIYRSGDLAKRLENGAIEFLGRIDHQVKIRGYRIEVGEIEHALIQLPEVKDAVVIAVGQTADQRKLAAYLLLNPDQTFDPPTFQKALRKRLPDYMVPSVFVQLDAFPKTSSGKVDRKALPTPEMKRPDSEIPYRAPKSIIQRHLATIWKDLLNIDRVGIDDNFFELGGNSLLAQKTVVSLMQQHKISLPITKLYQYGTIAGISSYLEGQGEVNPRIRPDMKARKNKQAEPIAIVGFAGRFPGAKDVWEFWDNLKEGRETIKFFTEDELDPSIPLAERSDPNYVKARGILENAEWFDERLFGITPILARIMDPQQRIFLEICRDALESTGHLPAVYQGIVGVYAGSGSNTYYLNNVLSNPGEVAKTGAFQALTLNEKDYLATRTAYQLNLTGPAVSVSSACSTSLLAVAQAVEGLRTGQCDVALAGGISITAPINSGHVYEEGAMFSDDGHCRPFDEDAKGTVFSDGAGVVVLKRLSDAAQDGDQIYAIIKGIGVNNDGGVKASFTAPSPAGQASAVSMALDDAEVSPETIGYVETHGTATPLGDPIEIEALKMAFGQQATQQYCKIGSLKSNMGHLTHAAGVAGLIKTALILHFKKIPASINYKRPNPAIDFENSPFEVNDRLSVWESEAPRRAGVSSFGVGGTNVHVVLEEYAHALTKTADPSTDDERYPYLVNWSAATEQSAVTYGKQLGAYLKSHPEIAVGDVIATLNATRQPLNHRHFVVAADRDDLLKQLTNGCSRQHYLNEQTSDIIFMFPGQGSQYANMGKKLYERFSAYRHAVDTCAALLTDTLQEDIRAVMFSDDAQRLQHTQYTQPAIFVTEYALATLWMSWGIQPTAFMGHSVGEFVGACLAGIFSLSDALALVAMRGRLISGLPTGSMAAIRESARLIAPSLPEGLSIAANNAPNLCVVAGPTDQVADYIRQLEREGIKTSLLHTSHAFHSSMMDPILNQFKAVVNQKPKHVPQKPVISTVTGTFLADSEATSSEYWVRHIREMVDFSGAATFASREIPGIFLEVGPGAATATLVKQHASIEASRVISGIRSTASVDELTALYESLGRVWSLGCSPDWSAIHGQRRALLTDLPTYAYERNYHWLAPQPKETAPVQHKRPEPLTEQTQKQHDTMRKTILINKIREILDEASGIGIDDTAIHDSFIEIGLDSLLLTQVAQTLKKEFNLPITFRKLNEEYYNLDLLADYLDKNLPANQYSAPQPPAQAQPSVQPVDQHAPTPGHAVASFQQPVFNPQSTGAASQVAYDSIALISQQINLISQQIALLQGVNMPGNQQPIMQHATAPHGLTSLAAAAAPAPRTADATNVALSNEELVELKKPFGATARIEKHASNLSGQQHEYLNNLIENYVNKTARSKAYTQEHRAYMADPRVVSGFKPLTKEMTYALVVNKSAGCRLWDIDGNEYIDALNGFGSSMLGNQPEVIKNALLSQIEEGYEIGPQHEKSGEVCKLICEFTGMDRAGLCNTGSEAVLGAMRIARTVTGRSTVVAFSGSYHGIVDEVIVRGTKKLKSFPAAPGIMPEAVQNMLILDYGTEESLRIIRERANELAAVLVEPIQSRRPEFVPIEFLKALREITEQSGTALIFDEVISGFRFHPRGAQGLFGITADIGTYGKVAGAGISIGIIAGKKRFMDALDGGFWQFGDESMPEAGVTYFAGTFVRHPLALATTKASLEYLKAQGPQLQENLNRNTEYLANRLNAISERYGTPIFVAQFGSLWKIKYKEEYPYTELLFALMRYKGIHILDGFPCFLTTAHEKADIERIIQAFEESLKELIEAGFIPTYRDGQANNRSLTSAPTMEPPFPNARLGKDQEGNPAWFVEDTKNPGQYLQVAYQ